MPQQDIRWEQRFSNFNKALVKLEEAVELLRAKYLEKDELKEELIDSAIELLKEGLIQRFEYTHELAWNVMKDYAFFQGNADVGGSRDATREALTLQIITNGHVWMDMIKKRNITSHTYNEAVANAIFKVIIHDFFPAFKNFQKTMEGKRSAK